MDPDSQLVEQARAALDGDTRAFGQLVERYEAKVLANCRYITRRPGESEDLAQEVFIKAYYALRKFEGRSSFRTWLHRIKVNHCLNFLKKGAGRQQVEIDDEETSTEVVEALRVDPKAHELVEREARRLEIGMALDSLKDTLRIPLIMRDMDHMSYQEIADELGLKLSAVKMRIKRAREEFRKTYEPGPTEH